AVAHSSGWLFEIYLHLPPIPLQRDICAHLPLVAKEPLVIKLCRSIVCGSVYRPIAYRQRRWSVAVSFTFLVYRRFGKADLKPHLPGLLQNMYRVFAVTQVGENDYVMKALMRVISVGQEEVTPFVQECLQNLVTVLGRV